eukprot:740500-Prorocentrum_minimum.AAC.3
MRTTREVIAPPGFELELSRFTLKGAMGEARDCAEDDWASLVCSLPLAVGADMGSCQKKEGSQARYLLECSFPQCVVVRERFQVSSSCTQVNECRA